LYLFVVSSYSAFLLSGCLIKFSSVQFSSLQFPRTLRSHLASRILPRTVEYVFIDISNVNMKIVYNL